MTNITQEAQRLIARDNLGTPTAVFRPNVIGSIIISSIILVIGVAWSIITIFIINTFALFMGGSSFSPISVPGSAFFDMLPMIVSIVFSLVGLLFVAIGLTGLIRTILNRNNQAVVCTDGVAYVMRKSADAFRWEQVLTVVNKTSVSRHTTSDTHGFTNTSTTVHNKYAVHCHDGRTFVFDDMFSHVEDLAEKIEVEVARQRISGISVMKYNNN